MTDEPLQQPKTSGNLALYKPGQAKTARWTAYLLGTLMVFLGALSLYAMINKPGHGVIQENLPVVGSITWFKLIAVVVGILGVWALHLVLNRPATVDLLIDTEQELRKVSWPSRTEVKSATMVVALVTFLMGFILYWADEVLQYLFRFFF
jgi:preprotein translocase SecE subunit